jgi:hypothetical protein
MRLAGTVKRTGYRISANVLLQVATSCYRHSNPMLSTSRRFELAVAIDVAAQNRENLKRTAVMIQLVGGEGTLDI